MRLHPLHHVTGITIVVLFFIYRLWGVISTVLEPLSPHELSKEELAVTSTYPHEGAQCIPKIIHQVYLGFDNEIMPQSWNQSQQSCIDLHPDYEHKVWYFVECNRDLLKSHQLWTNDTARELLTKEYPWFLETYDTYRYPIQRADSIRYFILAHDGGIYVDLDNVFNPQDRVSDSICPHELTKNRDANVTLTHYSRFPLGCQGRQSGWD